MQYIQQIITSLLLFFHFQALNVTISNVTLFKNAESLYADIGLNDVINAKSHSTLMSGLPLRMIVSTRITDDKNVQIAQTQTEIIIKYDVWDELFSVQYPDRKEQFRSTDSLKNGVHALRRIILVSQQQLQAGQYYYVHVKLSIQKNSSNNVIDSIDHDPANKTFGLSSIIKFFFGSSEPHEHWFRSDKFSLTDLETR